MWVQSLGTPYLSNTLGGLQEMGECPGERGTRNPKMQPRADVGKCITEASPLMALGIGEFPSKRGHVTDITARGR